MGRRKCALGILFVNLALGCASFAVADGSFEKLTQKLDHVVSSSGLAKSDLGLAVTNANGDVVYQLNADRKYLPASLSKIPMAMAALETLGPAHQFKTQIWMSGEVKNGVVLGDLILKGMGEPALVSERMWYLVNAFLRNEIKGVTGDLIVDESYFDSVRADKDRLPPSEGRAFDAPVGALSFNWNSINVFVRPGKKVGEPAKIFIDPTNDYIVEVVNQTKTTSRGEAAIDVKPNPVTKNGEVVGDKLIVSGSIAVGAKEVVKYRSITEPDIWTGANFKEFLRQRGVIVQGKVKKGKLPSGATMLTDEPGENLRSSVIDMLKFSNNFIAEMLTKVLAVENGASQGNLPQGIQVITKSMERAGLTKGDFGFVSPSGLSKLNQMSANQFVKLLKHISTSAYAPEFWAGLPISGQDGTMKGRIKGASVRAKTGLLTGVSGLSGMVLRPDGSPYYFAFIYNGSKYFDSRDVFDRLCMELAKN